MTRTFTLVLTGVVSGILAFAATDMLLRRDQAGDTPSAELAVTLIACAIVLAITGVGLATGAAWSRGLSLAVGLTGLMVGFGGLLLIVGSSLIAAGMFPDVLLQPQNLTIVLVMGLTGLMGLGLVMRRSGPPAATNGLGLARSWPVVAGIAIGIAAAWTWSAFVYELIPYRCCVA